MKTQEAKSMLKELNHQMQVLPRTRRTILHERLRTKIAEDIVALMTEKHMFIEVMAKKLELKVSEMREWIWTRDLKVSELSRLLDALDSEMYPVIRSRKLRRDL